MSVEMKDKLTDYAVAEGLPPDDGPCNNSVCMSLYIGNATRVPWYPKTQVTRPFSNP